MKDEKLTQIMFESLTGDHKLHSFEDWQHAGDWAMEMRFFPHAFHCYQMAAAITKNDEGNLTKMNNVLDKITNVLEFVPEKIKAQVDEIRLNNPLDPGQWLAIANSLLKDLTSSMASNEVNIEELDATKFALGFAGYCAARSGAELGPINDVLKDLIQPVEEDSWTSPKLDLTSLSQSKGDEAIKIVALGDNITLGLQTDWSIDFQNTYHYYWSRASKHKINLANNAISGAGALDLSLYLARDVLYYKPDVALINFGLNDVWLGPQILNAYEVILEQSIKMIQAHEVQAVLISPCPHIPSACPDEQKPSDIADEELSMDVYAQACKRVAIRTGCIFADAHSKFPKDKLDKFLSNGFNLPNQEGQKLIQAALDEVTI